MNFIERWAIEWKGDKIMATIFNRLSGYKTYITVGLGIIVSVAGHFWGPLTVGKSVIPQISSPEMWDIIWQGLTAAFIRHGISTSTGTSAGTIAKA